MVTPRDIDLSSVSLRSPSRQPDLSSVRFGLPSLRPPPLTLPPLNPQRGLIEFSPPQPLSTSQIARIRARDAVGDINIPEAVPREDYDPSVTPRISETDRTRQAIASEEERQANTGFLGHVGRALSAGLGAALNVRAQDVANPLYTPIQIGRDIAQDYLTLYRGDELEDDAYSVGDVLEDLDSYVFRPGYGTALAALNAVPGLDVLLFRGDHPTSETADFFQAFAETLSQERDDGWYRNIDDAFANAYDALETRKYVKGASEILLDPTNFIPFIGGAKALSKGARAFQTLRRTDDISALNAALQASRQTGADIARSVYEDTAIRGFTLAAVKTPAAAQRLAWLAKYRTFRSPEEILSDYTNAGGHSLEEINALAQGLQSGAFDPADHVKASGIFSPDQISVKPMDEQIANVSGEAENFLTQTPDEIKKLGRAGEATFSAMQVALRSAASVVYPNWANTNVGRQIAVASARTTSEGMQMAEIVTSSLAVTADPTIDIATDIARHREAILPSFGNPGSRAAVQHDFRGTVTNLVGVSTPDPIRHNFQRILEDYGTANGADLDGLLTPAQELLVQRIKVQQAAYYAMELVEGAIERADYDALINEGIMTRSISGQIQVRQVSDNPISADDADSYRTVISRVRSNRRGADADRQIRPVDEALRQNYIYNVGEDMIRSMGVRTYNRIAAKRLEDALEPHARRDIKLDIADNQKQTQNLKNWNRELVRVATRISQGSTTRAREAQTFDTLRTQGEFLGIDPDRVRADVQGLADNFEAFFKAEERQRQTIAGSDAIRYATQAARRAAQIVGEATKEENATLGNRVSKLQAQQDELTPRIQSLRDEIDDIQGDTPRRRLARQQFYSGLSEADYGGLAYQPWNPDDVEDLAQFREFLRNQLTDLRARLSTDEAQLRNVQDQLSKLPQAPIRPSRENVGRYRQIADRLERIATRPDNRTSADVRFNSLLSAINEAGLEIQQLTRMSDADAIVGRRFDEFLDDFNQRVGQRTAKQRRRDQIQNTLNRIVRRAHTASGDIPSYLRQNILNPNPQLRQYRLGLLGRAMGNLARLENEYANISRQIQGQRTSRALIAREEARATLGADELADYGFDTSGRPTDLTGLSTRAQDEMRALGIPESDIRAEDAAVRQSQSASASERAERLDIGSEISRRRQFRSRQTARGRRLTGLRDARRRLDPQLKKARDEVRRLKHFVVDYDRIQELQGELNTLRREIADARPSAIETRAVQSEDAFNLTQDEIRMREWLIDAIEPLWNSRAPTVAAKRAVMEKVNRKITRLNETLDEELAEQERTLNQLRREQETGRGPDLNTGVPRQSDEFSKKYDQLRAVDEERYPDLARSGKLFPDDIARGVEKQFLDPNNDYHRALQVAANTSGGLRFLATGFDVGASFIQQIVILANRPDLFATNLWAQLAQTFDPTYASRYLNENLEVALEMAYHGSPINTAQFTDFQAAVDVDTGDTGELAYVGGRGIFPTMGEKLTNFTERGRALNFMSDGVRQDLVSKQQTFGRGAKRTTQFFAGIFNTTGMVGKVELYKAMRDSWVNAGGDLRELSKFVNNATGYTDLAANGFTEFQEALERSTLFFAPRYTRATLAMLGNAFTGGLTGQQSRNMLRGVITALPFYYYTAATALGQEVHLDPRPVSAGGDGGRFMTLQVGGRNIGFGSKYIQLMRLAGGLAATDFTDADLYKFWQGRFYRDNPIAKFFRSQVPPAMEQVIAVGANQTYLGEPLNDLGAYSAYTARNLLPFSVETLTFDRGPNEQYFSAGALLGATAEMFGGRQYPITIYEQLRAAKDEAAMTAYEKPWAELNGLQRDTIEKDPAYRIQRLTAQMNQLSENYQRSLGEEGDVEIAMDMYFELLNEIDAEHDGYLAELTKRFENETITSGQYKEKVAVIDSYRNAAKRGLRNSAEFQGIQEVFRESREKNDQLVPAADLAYFDFIERVTTHPDLVDDAGEYDFALRRELEQEFVKDWGEEALRYAHARFDANRESEDFTYPAPLKELAYGNELFSYYWEQPRQVMAQMDRFSDDIAERLEAYHQLSEEQQGYAREADPGLRVAIRTEQEIRNILRENDRDLDIFIVRWHSPSNLRHPDNQWHGADLHYTSGDVRRGLWAGPPYPQSVNISREDVSGLNQ